MLRTSAVRLAALGKLEGLVVPPFTAYQKDGEVDLSVIPKQVELIEGMKPCAIFLGGTASEGASQTIEERVAIAEAYKAEFDRTQTSTKLILHIGATSLKESQILAQEAERIGVDAVASVTPTFFKPANVPQMVDWMKNLAAAAPKTPFFYYHIPVMTNVPATISVRKFLEAAGPEIPTMHGIKYTSTNLAEYADLTQVEGGKYDIMAGLSEQMVAALAMGARSAVSVPFNNPFATERYHGILDTFNEGNLKGALSYQHSINKLTWLLQVRWSTLSFPARLSVLLTSPQRTHTHTARRPRPPVGRSPRGHQDGDGLRPRLVQEPAAAAF